MMKRLAELHSALRAFLAPPCACIAVLLCAVSGDALAHHSHSGYGGFETLRGVVNRYQWANPHLYIYVDVEDPDAGTVTWTVEGGWPSDLVEFGVSRDFLQPGDPVSVTGRISRNTERQYMLGYAASKGDGPMRRITNLQMGDIEYVVPSAESDALADGRVSLTAANALVGTWSPLNPTARPLTEWNPFLVESRPNEVESGPDESNRLRAKCIPFSPPYNMTNEGVKGIEMRGEDIVIREASVGDVERVVRMNVDAHGESNSDNMQGDSIGHWDGDALIVETVFNNGEQGIVVRGVPFSSVARMEERFELSLDRSMLKYTYSVESPDYLKLPATGSVDWSFRPDLAMPRLPCDPENAQRYLDAQ